MAQRIEMITSQSGRDILSELSTSQLANMFPRYYMEKLPDVGKALDSVMNEKFKPLSREEADKQMQQSSASKTPKKFDPAIGDKSSYTYAREKMARLTDEQTAVLEEMKRGEISSDDPRLDFMKKLKPEDLKKAGIEVRTDDSGKSLYKFSDPNVTDEEITARLNGSQSSALKNERGRVVSTHDATLKPTERALLDTIASGESPDYNTITSGGGKFDGYNDHPRKRVQKVNSDAAGRYQFLSSTWDSTVKKFNAENPNDPITDFSPRNQDRAALHLAKNDYKRRTGRDLSQDLDSNDPQVRQQMGALLKQGLGGKGNNTTWQAFQTQGGEHWQGQFDSNLKRNQEYATATPRMDTPEARAQVAAEIKASKQGQNISELQKVLAAQGAPPGTEVSRRGGGQESATPQQTKTSGNGKIYTAGDSIGQGVGSSNKLPSVAQQGLSFSDPRMVQQLKNVPPGSTVQLYAGTNDAAGKRLDPKEYDNRMSELKRIAEERGLNVSIHGPHSAPNQKWNENVPVVNDLLGNAARNSGFKYVDNTASQADARDNTHMSPKSYQQLYQRGMEQTTPVQPEAPQTQAEVRPQEKPEEPVRPKPEAMYDEDAQPIPTMAEGGEIKVVSRDGEIKPIKTYAEGGEEDVAAPPSEGEVAPVQQDQTPIQKPNQNTNEGEIKALPIGALKNDNSVVVDKGSNPLFTMNTKEESANYDPNTGKVNVDRNGRDTQTADDGDSGKDGINKHNDLNNPQAVASMGQSQATIPTDSSRNSFDTSLNLTDNIFKDPSFERAMSRSRFDIAGDSAMGGHFSTSGTMS